MEEIIIEQEIEKDIDDLEVSDEEIKQLEEESAAYNLVDLDSYEKDLPMDDAFRLYLREIGKIPLLPWPKQLELFQQLRAGDETAKDKIIECNLRLTVSIAKKYMGRGLSTPSLVQEGNLGLIKAVERFDASKEYHFSPYATWWIKQAISRAIADKSNAIRIPVHMYETMNKMRIFSRNWVSDFCVEPTTEEIAKGLDLSVATIKRIEKYLNTVVNPDSIDRCVRPGEDDETELGNFIADSRNPFTEREEELDIRLLKLKCMNLLSPREYFIFYYRVLEPRTFTLEELGKEMGVTRERIRQIESKARRKFNVMLQRDKTNSPLFQNIQLNDYKYTNTRPYLMVDLVRCNYLSKTLEPLDYEIFFEYYINEGPNNRDVVALANYLSLSVGDVNARLKAIFNENIALLTDTKSVEYKTAEKLFDPKLRFSYDPNPNNKKINACDIKRNMATLRDFFSHTDYESIQSIIYRKQLFLSASNKELLGRYYEEIPHATYNSQTYSEVQKEINLLLTGYNSRISYLPVSTLRKDYINNKELFSLSEQITIEYLLLKTMSDETFRELSRTVTDFELLDLKPIVIKLEKLHYKIDEVLYEEIVPKEILKEVLTTPNFEVSEEERHLLISLINNQASVRMTANIRRLLGLVVDFYCDLHASLKTINPNEYEIYLSNNMYDFEPNVRELMRLHLIEGISLENIANNFNMPINSVKLLFSRSFRRLETYRLGIKKVINVTNEDLVEFFRKYSSYDEVKRKIICYKCNTDLSSERIANSLGIDTQEVNVILTGFYRDFRNFKSSIKVSHQDIVNAIKADGLGGVLEENEIIVLSWLHGIKSKYNPSGEILPLKDIADKYHFNISQANYYKKAVDKIKWNINGLPCSRSVFMPKEEIEEALNDPLLPLDDDEKRLLINLYGINTPYCTVKEYANNINVTNPVLVARLEESLIKIKKYQNGEIKGKIAFEKDIEPLLKYFAKGIRNLVIDISNGMSLEEIMENNNLDKTHATRLYNYISSRLRILTINKKDVSLLNFDEIEGVLGKTLPTIVVPSKIGIPIFSLYYGIYDFPLTIEEIVAKYDNKYSYEQIVSIIHDVLCAIKKKQQNIPCTNYFDQKDVISFYNNNRDMKVLDYLRFANAINGGIEYYELSDYIKYSLISSTNKIPFSFNSTSANQAREIMFKYRGYLSPLALNVLYNFYGITPRDLMTSLEERTLFDSLLSVYYEKTKNFSLLLS